MGHLIGAIASDDLVLVAAEAFEQGPTQRASSGSMPLVASNRGGETSAACPGSATGSIRLFAAALVASGVRRAGMNTAEHAKRTAVEEAHWNGAIAVGTAALRLSDFRNGW